MMNPVVKSLWLAALRSGEYTQTCGVLKNGQGYCCLGVLTDLFIKENPDAGRWALMDENIPMGMSEFRGAGKCNIGILSDVVCEWAGLEGADRHNPLMDEHGPDDKDSTLSGYNDDGVSFSKIADLIERCL